MARCEISLTKKDVVKNILLCIPLVLFLACSDDDSEPKIIESSYQCQTISSQNNYTRIELLQSFDESILQGLASIDIPNEAGAMGRNKPGYFHVRFQMGIAGLADYAVRNEDTQALEYALKAIEYAFEYQTGDGDFELIVPANLTDEIANEADLASGVSFFLSSVGLALNNFEQSAWYNAAALDAYKSRIDTLRPSIAAAAAWLATKKEILEMADDHAPNRLFFNALSFYSLGEWLDDPTLKTIGISFAKKAISKKHPEGYFIEGGGWDSSYQGVAINVGFNLYSLLPDSEPIKPNVWECLSCASDWQKSRILPSGEISSEENTRVYPGGESFLGNEKDIDWVDTMVGLFMMGYYSNEQSYLIKANEVKEYYQ